METRTLGAALQTIMKRHGWTQGDLAERLGVTRGWVSHNILGRRDPGIMSVAKLLSRVGWEVVLRPKREESKDVKRREFNATFIGAAASITILPQTKVGPYENPDYLKALAGRLGSLREEQGGVPLISEASRHLRQISPLLKSGDRALQTAASRLAHEASIVFFDAEKSDAAERASWLSLAFARSAEEVDMAAANFAILATYLQPSNPERAAEYARQGIREEGVSSEWRAQLYARRAQALSRLKRSDRRAVRSTLESALQEDGVSSYAKAIIDGTAGVVLYRVGESDTARSSLDNAIQAFADSPLSFARWLAKQATASMLVGNLSAAAEDIHVFAHVYPLVTSARLDSDLFEVYRTSRKWEKVPEIRQAREALRAVYPQKPQRKG